MNQTAQPIGDPTMTGDSTPPSSTGAGPMDSDLAPQQRLALWRQRVSTCKRRRRQLVQDWAVNVDYRRGKPFQEDSDQDRIAVNVDWPLTKAKQAKLFSQVPTVILKGRTPQFTPLAAAFAKKLNDTLEDANVAAAMDECLPDVINAAGIAAVIVGYEARTVLVQVPQMDPSTLPPDRAQALATQPGGMPMITVPKVIDSRFTVTHLGPDDLLWPSEFKQSNFDQAPWIGRSGRLNWSEAKAYLRLRDDQKEQVLGDDRNPLDRLTHRFVTDHNEYADTEIVGFDEIFYWRYLYHDDEKSFHAIHHLVFVHGLDQPVIDEPWTGQRLLQDGGYLGACQYPIRVLTLAYLSGDAIPPSDSAVGRPQVRELIEGRTQMMLQRKRSLPLRWHDVNRLDPLIGDQIAHGEWQDSIPVQGDGSRILGEVARANYPRDDSEFNAVARTDLQEIWQLGSNQIGTFNAGQRSASEAQIVESNFQTQIGYERARCVAFFVGIARVMAGLIALYGNFQTPDLSPQDVQTLAMWDRRRINQEFIYKVRADATVLLDAEQRVQRLVRLLNFAAKSGYLNVKPLIEELVELHGVDPAECVVDPQPQNPDQPNISYRFDGADLLNPVVLAILMQAGQAPSPQMLQAAQNLLSASGVEMINSVQIKKGQAPVIPDAIASGSAAPATGTPPVAAANPGTVGAAVPANLPPSGVAPAPSMPLAPSHAAHPPAVGKAHPNWQLMDRINTRRENE